MNTDDDNSGTWRMPIKKPIAQQATERGVPVPAVGSTVAELRQAGFEIDDDVPDGVVFCAYDKSPTGYTWRFPRAVIEALAGGQQVTASWLRERGVMRPDSGAPNWSVVKAFLFDEHDHLVRIDFWQGPTNEEIAEENERRKEHGLPLLETARVVVTNISAEYAIAMADVADASIAQKELVDDALAKKEDMP